MRIASARHAARPWILGCGLTLASACTPLDSRDQDQGINGAEGADRGADDADAAATRGTLDAGGKAPGAGGDAGSADGSTDAGRSADMSVGDARTADTGMGDTTGTEAGANGSGNTPVPCTDMAPCRLPDNSTGICTAGACGACAGGSCAPPGCTDDSACAYLNAPCLSGACKAGVCGVRTAPVGQACDDGAWCTTADACDSAGVCRGVAKSCDDGLSCTADRCVEASRACESSVSSGCKIDGACVPAGARDPANACLVCDPSRSTSARSTITTAAPGDGCCPQGANALTDADCAPVCGNGVKEGFEGCDDGGAAGGCTDQCTSAPIQRAVVTPYYASCALTSKGKVTCWGDAGNPFPNDTFTEICGSTTYVCALRPNGKAACWGGTHGSATPPANEVFTHLGCGGDATCGLRSDGTAVCWGASTTNPVLAAPSDKFSKLAGGADVMCGLKVSDQTAKCWGWDGGGGVSGVPAKAFAQIVASYWCHCGVDSAGKASCWGTSLLPGLDGATGIKRLAGGQGSECAVLSSGKLQCWADDRRAQVLSGMPAGSNFDGVSISLNGGTHECAITTADKVYCWGEENFQKQQDVPAALKP